MRSRTPTGVWKIAGSIAGPLIAISIISGQIELTQIIILACGAFALSFFAVYTVIQKIKRYNEAKTNFFTGTVLDDKLITAPFSQQQVVWYRVVIKWLGYDKTDTMGKYGWHLLLDDQKQTTISVKTSSKSVHIEQATFDIKANYTFLPTSKLQFPEEQIRELLTAAKSMSTNEKLEKNKFWIKEYTLLPKQSIVLVEGEQNTITDKTISNLKNKYLRQIITVGILFLGLLIVGGWFIAAIAFGILRDGGLA